MQAAQRSVRSAELAFPGSDTPFRDSYTDDKKVFMGFFSGWFSSGSAAPHLVVDRRAARRNKRQRRALKSKQKYPKQKRTKSSAASVPAPTAAKSVPNPSTTSDVSWHDLSRPDVALEASPRKCASIFAILRSRSRRGERSTGLARGSGMIAQQPRIHRRATGAGYEQRITERSAGEDENMAVGQPSKRRTRERRARRIHRLRPRDGGSMSRCLTALGTTALIVFLVVADDPEYASATAAASQQAIERWFDNSFVQKEVRVSGLVHLSSDEISARLPWDKTWLRWWWSRADIVERFSHDPVIQSASIEGCTDRFIAFDCFQLNVVERSPALIAAIRGDRWLIARDGAFLAPLDTERRPRIGGGRRQEMLNAYVRAALESGPRPVAVSGVLQTSHSPDLVRARLRFIAQTVDLLRDRAGLAVDSVRITSSEELVVKLQGSGLIVTFEPHGGDVTEIREQIDRLRVVLAQYGGRAEELAQVDLGFRKIAVVVPRPPRDAQRAG